MAKKRYNVVRHTEIAIVLAPAASLLRTPTTIVRSSITSVSRTHSMIVVSTSDGRSFDVEPGIRREQRDLVKAAFDGLL